MNFHVWHFLVRKQTCFYRFFHPPKKIREKKRSFKSSSAVCLGNIKGFVRHFLFVPRGLCCAERVRLRCCSSVFSAAAPQPGLQVVREKSQCWLCLALPRWVCHQRKK